MAMLPLKASRNEQCSVIRFLWAEGLSTKSIHIHPTVQTWPPSDYRLYGPMKKMLGGQKFASDTEVQSTVRQWLRQQPASFFFA